MFERFTDRARRVTVLASEEAKLLGHGYIGTEHLLLGLLREGEGVAAQALRKLNVDLDDVRAQVDSIIGQGNAAPTGHIPFTPRAKKVLELSLREALQLGHNYIGTEHILLGLIREGEGIAANVLSTMYVSLAEVRQTIIEILGGYSTGLGNVPATTKTRMIVSNNKLPASASDLPKFRVVMVGDEPGDWVQMKQEKIGGVWYVIAEIMFDYLPDEVTRFTVEIAPTDTSHS